MIQQHRAVYVSRAVGPAASNLMALSEILGASQRNNRTRGLTGMLLAHDGWFLQALEGQKAAIDRLFTDLELDSRHGEMRLISFEPIETPAFAEWSMGQAMITPSIASRLEGRSLTDLTADEAMDLLLDCADTLRRAA